ncbi:MAG: hypothetical protein GC154_16440 [bacterium]|nr:hypothetical protein [bacterium]
MNSEFRWSALARRINSSTFIPLLFIAALYCHAALAQSDQAPALTTPWPAVDELHRALPLSDEAGPPKPDRFVGIFYFLWLGQHGDPNLGPFNVTDIMREHPLALQTPAAPPWGPEGFPHYWGEPLYGYYRSEDPWVLRRHAQLLADAGIDVLIFDTTNAVIYDNVYHALCETFTQIRAEGGTTPRIAFMLNTQAGATARRIYEDLYKPGRYPDLWFIWRGKPLMICDPAEADDEVKNFFTLRKAHWPFTQVNTPYAWHWEAIYPQVYGYTEDENIPEQVNVSVAQNLRQSDGAVSPMSHGDARGRSFHRKSLDTRPGSVNWGYNFAEQWTRALELAPPFVMVTGWNEWIASRFHSESDPVMFVDQFDEQCSRDIEMMKGGHGDNYYWQLTANVRRYKGAPPIPQASGAKTIDVNGEFAQWKDVLPEYLDHDGETRPRDFNGAGAVSYTNHTGRNELLEMKVARDADFVYFYARTAAPITPHNDPNWMMLMIDADGDPLNGWLGFDFIINRNVISESQTTLEANTGGWSWRRRAEIDYRVEGCEIQIAVPRTALGLPGGDGPMQIDFQWADNWQRPGDVMDLYVSGDAAPEGRFRYRYQVK